MIQKLLFTHMPSRPSVWTKRAVETTTTTPWYRRLAPWARTRSPPQRFVFDTEMQPGEPEPGRRFVEDTEELGPAEASQDESTEAGPLTIDTASIPDSQDSEPLADTCLIIDGKVCVACILCFLDIKN